ncbi:MAG: tRNA epoxyqueuosine(34) reductase QueG [Verrucomicrobiales bacterium]
MNLPSPRLDGPELKRLIIERAHALGFDDCRIAACAKASHADEFTRWIEDGRHGDMAWMERNPARRTDPREVVPGARSMIVLALNYFQGPRLRRSVPGVIARYAWGEDYHEIVEKKLKSLNVELEQLGGVQRYYVDTGPVLERDFASDAGVGWNGKSTVQIHRRLGTWFFLAEIITTLELPPDSPESDHCGKCTRCIDVCPTEAITAPRHVDARRCISYLTIEHKGSIPEELRPALGERIYGCDDCLEVCPWNRFARVSRELRFASRDEVTEMSLRDFLALDDPAFRKFFKKSPIKRLKRPRFLRNVCVALGNVGTSADLPALEKAAADPDPLITEHAHWAIDQIHQREKR